MRTKRTQALTANWPVRKDGTAGARLLTERQLLRSAPDRTMTMQLRILGFKASADLRRRLEEALKRFGELVPVSAAAVVVERERERAPAFHAAVHLAVPGPDLHAEAREHTVEAVWLKVVSALRRQVEGRESRRKARGKSQRQMPLSTSRWGIPGVAARG